MANNIVVIASVGNDGQNYEIVHPANIPGVIKVGGSVVGDWTWSFTNLGLGTPTNGTYIDLIAPAENVESTIPPNSYSTPWNNNIGDGTSFAAPMVSATAALMLSVNSCLYPPQVRDILVNTADKVHPQTVANYFWNPATPGHSKEAGYGRLNTKKAVVAAQEMYKQSLDLYIKDIPTDFGAEPLSAPPYTHVWESPDIWVRNANDGFANKYHQNPLFNTLQNPNYVYVRVRNKSCTPSSASQATLHLYWAKASTVLNWPASWNGSQTNPLMGQEIGSGINLPAINGGAEYVVEIPWVVPDPMDYASMFFGWNGHFCLLARIVSNDDGMYQQEATNTELNTYTNNNIAQKNVTVVDGIQNNGPNLGGAVIIGNPQTYPIQAGLSFEIPVARLDIFDKAQVLLKMDDVTWRKWKDGGSNGEHINVYSEDEQLIELLNHEATINDLEFNESEKSVVGVLFHFKVDDAFANDETYALRLKEFQSLDGERLHIGGETYEIRKYQRPPFDADAGSDLVVNKNEIVTLTANSISEPVSYKWYDCEGNLIHTGQNLTISEEFSTKYRLEVMAATDGFKDWDSVRIEVRTGRITSLYPNPVTDLLTVTHQIENSSSSYIVISQPFSNTVSNYIINPSSTFTTINFENFAVGIYNVLLVCDGNIVDAKTIQKQ